MSALTYLTGLVCGALFLTSSLYKFRSGKSESQIARYEILPYRAVPIAAVSLPLAEFLVGAAMFSGLLARPALVLAAGMLAAFSVAVIVNLLRGRDIDCGCRSDNKTISWSLAAQDAVLGSVCLVAATQPSTGPLQVLNGSGGLGASDAIAISIAALLGWVLWQIFSSAVTASRTIETLKSHA